MADRRNGFVPGRYTRDIKEVAGQPARLNTQLDKRSLAWLNEGPKLHEAIAGPVSLPRAGILHILPSRDLLHAAAGAFAHIGRQFQRLDSVRTQRLRVGRGALRLPAFFS